MTGKGWLPKKAIERGGAAMAIKRLLITGAAGGLGKVLRTGLVGMAEILRLSSRSDVGELAPHEEWMRVDLADAPAVDKLLEGVDAVVHMGGQSTEAPWDVIVASNIIGCINLYEAARKAGTRRIILASSNHVIGLYPRDRRLDHTTPPRPDSRYGLSKAFGEDLACLYAYKYGISSMCIRIGSSFPEPRSRRMLSSWQSYDDLIQQIRSALTADYLYEIVYGVSANTRNWWDNSNAERLGYRPKDDSEQFAAKVAEIGDGDPISDALQGGAFAGQEYVGDLERCLKG
jgi:uronate dehydrogenase